jgi:hypothetical protein
MSWNNERRKILIDRMNQLETSGFDCRNCAGHCCTFTSNSMQITPLETIEILNWLTRSNLYNDETLNKLKSNVSEFRLDHYIGSKGRSLLRRTYTCPFFKGESLGCMIEKDSKPYGCLAFNSHHEIEKANEHCYSELNYLENREKKFIESENLINQKIKTHLNSEWDKLPIPLALLDFWGKNWQIDFLPSSL